MAVDTENKRRSVSGYTGNVILPVSDGSISAADRAHVAGLYSGLVYSALARFDVVSFFLESMDMSSMTDEQMALSTLDIEQMALSILTDESLEN